MVEHIKRYYISYLFILSLFLVMFINRNNINCLAVFNDEFGYWGNAAAMAGKDWTALMARTPYYSLGYSLFLVPLFKMNLQFSTMYKLAVLMNLVFVYISYFCALYIASRLFPQLDLKIRQLVCFVSVASCASLFYSQIAWCETLLFTLMWCLFASFVRLESKWSYPMVLVIVMLTMLMYLVHQRVILLAPLSIGILLAICIQRKKYASAVFVLIITALLYFCYKKAHSVQINTVYSASGISNKNNVEVSQSYVSGYLSRLIDNLKLISYSLVCKLGIVLLTTSFTLIISYQNYVEKINRKEFAFFGSRTLIITATLLMLALSSIQMFSTERKDLVVYSRYLDFALPGLTLIGLCELIENSSKYRNTFFLSIIGTLPIVILSMFRIDLAEGRFNMLCCPIWASVIWKYGGEANIFTAGFILVEISMAILSLCLFLSRKRLEQAGRYVFLVLLIIINLYGYKYANERTVKFREGFGNAVATVADRISEYPDAEVCCLMPPYAGESETEYRMKELQFYIDDRPVKSIDASLHLTKGALADGSLIVTNETMMNNSIRKYCEMIVETDGLCLYKYHDEMLDTTVKL